MKGSVRSCLGLLVVALLAASCSSDSEPAAESSSSRSSTSESSSSNSSDSSSSSGSQSLSADWTSWGHDGANTGATLDAPPPNGLFLAWESIALDGEVYAQPLVVGNQVIVATENNSVYAFDAANGEMRWVQPRLGDPVDGASLPCGNIDPVGITSTPVADPATNRLYVVGMMQPAHHELIVLALDTGAVLFRRPIDAAGADPVVHNQRGALALANGRVYVPFGGRFGDCGEYKGRIVAIAADGSGAPIEYAVRANREGGLWAPPGPVVDEDGSLLVAAGNSDGTIDFDDGNAVIRLSPDLLMIDEFAPADWAQLNAGDVDLGTTSPVTLDNGRVFQVGKSGVGYVLDAAQLGGEGGELGQAKVCDRVMGGLAHDGDTVFVPCTDNNLHMLTVGSDSFTNTWTAEINHPGPPIVAGALVWVLDVDNGTVHALDRLTGNEVFNADVGAVTPFSAPAAGTGAVFVAGGRKVEAFRGSGGGAGGLP